MVRHADNGKGHTMNNGLTNRIQESVNSVIVGKPEVVEKVLMAILAQGHILLEDVPGVGKTTLAMAFARTLGIQSKRVQFTSDTMPSDIVGFSLYDKDKGDFVFKPGVVMTNVLLADEINRTSSKTQSALLEAMEEHNVSVDGKTYRLPDPFVVIATENPVGSAGTMMLPSAQLDRFLIRLTMGYPDSASQIELLRERHHDNPLDKVKPVCSEEQLRALIAEVEQVHISDAIYEYVVALAERTRADEMLELGVSPRGALCVCNMAKAHALVHGRNFVTPEDVQSIMVDVCAHRVVLSSKARLAHESDRNIIARIVDEVPVPQTIE